MRITTNMMMRNYNSRLNRVLGDLNLKNEKVTHNGRKYLKAREDPSTAVRSYQLRRSYKENEDYLENVKNVKDSLLTAEGSVESVSKLSESVYARSLEAIHGTHTVEDRRIYAEELRGIQDSMVLSLNSTFDGKFLFGGTGTTEAPFELIRGEGGERDVLTYRGIDVTTGVQYPLYEADEKTMREPTEKELKKGAEVLKNLADEKIFKDLGFGLEEDGDGNTINNTAFNSALPGISIVGFGMEEGVPLEDVYGKPIMEPKKDDDGNIILKNNKLSDEFSVGTKIYQQRVDGTQGEPVGEIIEDKDGNAVLKVEKNADGPLWNPTLDSDGNLSLAGLVDVSGNPFAEESLPVETQQATATVNKNLILNIGELAKLFEASDADFDYGKIKACTDMLDDQRMNVLQKWTDIGVHTQFLETTQKNLETSQFRLNEKIIDVEYDDMEEAIMAFKEADNIYRAALKMGMNVLSPSFIDFMS